MALRREGVRVGVDDRVDLGRYLWWPDARTRRRLGLGAGLPGTNVCLEGNL